MDDKNRKTSLKVNASEVSSFSTDTPNADIVQQQKEVYKRLPEDIILTPISISNGKDKSNGYNLSKVDDLSSKLKEKEEVEGKKRGVETTKMVHEEHEVNDGADEQMLGMGNKLTEKRDEVKFINGDHKNGDAKIDIGVVNGKVFTGMTKEELMKYANDPFWVRLRWIFFIGFWAIWAGMLVGAILIIIDAPKCNKAKPLAWYERGPLVKFSGDAAELNDTATAKKMIPRGVVYELPPESTYSVHEPEIEKKIKDLVAKYEETGVKVVLDITPNYVSDNSKFMKNALTDVSQRSAFIWLESVSAPNNWLSIVNGTAWAEKLPGNFVLSQFGDGLYDLHMNNEIVKREFKDVLQHLLNLGVKGFRLKNSKFFLINRNIKDEEVPSNDPSFIHTDYGFWTHSQTTFQEGLGDLLFEFRSVVKNHSEEAFLSIAEDMFRPQAYKTKLGSNHSIYSIDLPIYGPFAHLLSTSVNVTKLNTALNNTLTEIGDTWLQWNLNDAPNNSSVPADAYALFMALIPGTPVLPGTSQSFLDIPDSIYKHIEELRESNVFSNGDFHIHIAGGLIAYTRFKQGNPGYLVVFNPHNVNQVADFSDIGLPKSITVNTFSKNNAVPDIAPKTVVHSDMIQVSPTSTIIYTYVPVQSE